MNEKYHPIIDQLDKYPILGEGKLGVVYQVNDSTCVKVSKNININKKEIGLYEKYRSMLFPEIYLTGENFIVMELIKGISLKEHLDMGNKLEHYIMTELVKMFEEGHKVGLSLNPNARHIIISEENRIRLVDLDDIVKFASPKPFMLFHRLREHGYRDAFLDFVKTHQYGLYVWWFGQD
ncbi:MAG: hypothetical protein ACYC21_07800 [Eubacteriales bacterium]